MDKQENVRARLDDAKRPRESDVAAPGRGGKMSACARPRLPRGHGLATVSRGLGVAVASSDLHTPASHDTATKRVSSN